MELLLGCGVSRDKRLCFGSDDWQHLVTLDINPDTKPDKVWDLNVRPLPFDDGIFDEIHAYEVLEHIGRQGDWRGFFEEWSEWWRLLKPGGLFVGTSPASDSNWAWGDPGHTRIISRESITFLDQTQYTDQVGRSPMTDYRFVYRADFDPVHVFVEGETFEYALRAVKPARIK